MSLRLELGNGHFMDLIASPWTVDHEEPTTVETCQGGIHVHPWTKGPAAESPMADGTCAEYVQFKGRVDSRPLEPGQARPEWEVISLHPLTLSPSILCRLCGCHGYIRDGKWVDC